MPATCLTQRLRDQDAAFRNFFGGRARYPRFKRKGASGSLRFQRVGAAWACGVVSLPKLGALKVAEALPKAERPDLVTLSRDAAGRYHVSFCARVEIPLLPITHRVVGVDLGLTDLATLSSGEKIPNPKRYHARLRQERQSALHALTTRLVREFDVICIEDLNVKGLARGRLARAIQDVAFSEVRRQLRYKSEWYGKILVEVHRWYPSSKSCSQCWHTLDELRLDERRWKCPRCATSHDRDVNAARNLLAEGLRQLAGRDDRDLRVDAGDACPEEILVQVLAEEARSGQWNRTCMEQARFG
ncbi:MAG TPA: transposase [Steroidobacteraceae bacterium]